VCPSAAPIGLVRLSFKCGSSSPAAPSDAGNRTASPAAPSAIKENWEIRYLRQLELQNYIVKDYIFEIEFNGISIFH